MNTQTQYVMETESLIKQYGEQRVVNGLSIQIKPGEVFAVLGANGAGKTTLLRMLTTLLPPDGGVAKVFGFDICREPEKVREHISLTGQFATVDEELTAVQNLEMFCELYGMDTKMAKERTADLLAEFSLADVANKPVSQFSGGMRRRLDLAASLVIKPGILFLDEPTTGLDPRTRIQIWDTLRKLSTDGTTIILTTQYLEEVEQIADRVAIMDKGRLTATGTPDELKFRVGGTVLMFVVEDEDRLAEAKSAAESIIGSEASSSVEKHSVEIPVSGAEQVQAMLAKMAEMGITVTEFSMKRLSMDDVFFAATQEDEQARNKLKERRGSILRRRRI